MKKTNRIFDSILFLNGEDTRLLFLFPRVGQPTPLLDQYGVNRLLQQTAVHKPVLTLRLTISSSSSVVEGSGACSRTAVNAAAFLSASAGSNSDWSPVVRDDDIFASIDSTAS